MKTLAMATECPCCGQAANAISNLSSDNRPRPGNFIVCSTCGAICQLDEHMAMVLVDQKATGLDVQRERQRRVREMRGLPV